MGTMDPAVEFERCIGLRAASAARTAKRIAASTCSGVWQPMARLRLPAPFAAPRRSANPFISLFRVNRFDEEVADASSASNRWGPPTRERISRDLPRPVYLLKNK